MASAPSHWLWRWPSQLRRTWGSDPAGCKLFGGGGMFSLLHIQKYVKQWPVGLFLEFGAINLHAFGVQVLR